MGIFNTFGCEIIWALMIIWVTSQVIGLTVAIAHSRINVKLSRPKSSAGRMEYRAKKGVSSSSPSQFILPFDKKKLKVETGLEFLREWDLDWDEDYLFGNEPYKKERRNLLTTWTLVQKFIKAVKGIPNLLKPEEDENLLTGEDFEKKPEWCFQTFLLPQLVNVELTIYGILKKYESQKKIPESPALDSYLQDIELSTLRVNLRKISISGTVTDVHEDSYLYVASHPILVYRMIRRFSMDLQPILKRLKTNKELMHELYEYANPSQLVFPTVTDPRDALQLVRNAQYGNMLNIYEFARGKLGHVHTGIQLNALHAIEIGTYYLEHRVFDAGVEWMHYALETAKQSLQLNHYPVMKQCFNDLLNVAIDSHNADFRSKQKAVDVWWEHDIFNTTITPPFHPKNYVRMVHILKPYALQEKHISSWNWAVLVNFKLVCAGENLQNKSEKAFLKCWYDTSRHAYWRINPLKIELLHKDPPVVQIYDFIGPKLMKIMKSYSVPRLKRSQVADNSSLDARRDHRRTSSGAWFSEFGVLGKYVRPLTRKFEHLSGLKIYSRDASEDYQVAAYGSSHFYEVHHDGYSDERRVVKLGNRITTIMAYLSSVAFGGRTGFPIYGFSAKPVKGSILMWNNLRRNGIDREKTALHGACPVTLGVKWITNKWVLYYDNMLRYPCALNPNE